MANALEHIRVLDIGQFEAAPTCGLLMALLGAEVIKIEPPGKGDPARFATPGAPADADSMYFIYMNLSKKSITLDLERAKGAEIFKEMAKKADVVIENFAPGTMEKMGLGYDVLKGINPRLIMGTITPYGSGGPYSNYPGNDMTAEAMGGASVLTGFATDPPVRPGPNVGEAGAAVYMFGAIMAALHQRERTGKGQLVEVAMTDAVIMNLRTPLTFRQTARDQMYQGEPIQRYGGLTTPLKTKDTDTQDNLIIVSAAMPRHHQALFEVAGRKDILEDPRIKDMMALLKDPAWAEKYFGALTDWFSQQHSYDAFKKIGDARVPVGITLNTTQIFNDPNFIERKTVVELEHPKRGKFKTPTTPLRLEKSPPEVKNAPLLGEHNNEVYAKLLGYTKEDLAELKEVGVI